jgi:hypothetical protein
MIQDPSDAQQLTSQSAHNETANQATAPNQQRKCSICGGFKHNARTCLEARRSLESSRGDITRGGTPERCPLLSEQGTERTGDEDHDSDFSGSGSRDTRKKGVLAKLWDCRGPTLFYTVAPASVKVCGRYLNCDDEARSQERLVGGLIAYIGTSTQESLGQRRSTGNSCSACKK